MIREPVEAEKKAQPRGFDSADGVAFGATVICAFAVYLMTAAPQVTFGYSGIDAAAAMYPGASSPSGHPVWAIFGWSVIKVFPFGNIAWRLVMGCAAAAAVACGLLAATVSHVGGVVFQSEAFERWSRKEQYASRVVSGTVAGLGIAFERGFWSKVVVVDTWPLTMLLFAMTMFCLGNWFFAPARKRWLLLASFLHGLSLSESQALAPVTFALPFFLAFGNARLGRDLLFAAAGGLWVILRMKQRLWVYGWQINSDTNHLLLGALILTAGSWLGVCLRSGKPFSEIKTLIPCALLLSLGLAAYFLVPIFSMMNPPMNWGYARTEEGFFHVLSRGQFDSFQPTADFQVFIRQFASHFTSQGGDVGVLYVLAAAVPFLLFHKMSAVVKRWLLGILLMWVLVIAQTVAALNLEPPTVRGVESLFGPANALLMILAGVGLMVFASGVARARSERTGDDLGSLS